MKEWWDELRGHIGHILAEAIVVALWLATLWGVSWWHEILYGKEGLIAFEETPAEFKVKWLIQAAEIGGLVLFFGRSLLRIIRGPL